MQNTDDVKEQTAPAQDISDVCACCGRPVPEGRMICWKCEHQYESETLQIYGQKFDGRK